MTNTSTSPSRRRAWLAMFGASLAVAVVSFVLFGLIGGFVLLVGLNGFSGSQAEPIFIAYFIFVLGASSLVAALFNWLILRRGFPGAGLSAWAALVPALVSAVGLLIVGPALALILIQLFFRAGI